MRLYRPAWSFLAGAGLVAGLLSGLPAPAAGADPGASVAKDGSLRVGTQLLRRCDLGIGRATWCGSLSVPLDPDEPAAAPIRIGFGWLPAGGPATTAPAAGTVVAQEGGPGYPSTGTAADFAAMLSPLLRSRNLLVVDARGTGRSGAIDCPSLQRAALPLAAGAGFPRAAAACADHLNHSYRRAGGGYVHASDLFSTANSVRDLAAVLGSLRLAKVDLYGDSYGTYFAQSFLARYPQLLRSVVLDSAYEARGLDPWYTTTVSTARSGFDAVCARALGCPAGSSWARIGALARQLRAHPVTGLAPGTGGRLVRVRLDVTALVNIVNDAGYDPEPYRQLDGAARALLRHGDAVPLLRLYAQDIGYDYSDYSAPAGYYSDGLYLAVACTDYPQLFSMRASVARRREQLAAAVRALPAGTFAPFSTREWLSILPYTETYTGCLDWPAPTHRSDPPIPRRAPMNPTGVPVLVLNGELDSLTPAVGGAHVARQIGSAATALVAANNVHLVGLDASACGARVVRSFIADPASFTGAAAGRRAVAGCLPDLPAIHAVGDYPDTLAHAVPARGPAPLRQRRIAAIAVAAAGDAVIRAGVIDGSGDLGLRGGRIESDPAGVRLDRVRWTSDTSVSGRIVGDARAGRGQLEVRTPDGRATRVLVRWSGGARAWAIVDGVTVWVPAP